MHEHKKTNKHSPKEINLDKAIDASKRFKQPNPKDFIPYGFNLIEDEKLRMQGKLVELFGNIFKLLLLVVILFLSAKITYAILIKRNENFANVSWFISYLTEQNDMVVHTKEWDDLIEEIGRLQRDFQRLRKKFQLSMKWQTQMKETIDNLKNETISLAAERFEQLNYKIDETINLYEADKLGETDFALESAGGTVTSTPDTIPYPSNKYLSLFGIKVMHLSSDPQTLIRPGNLPGQCFAFAGQKGKIRIQLIQPVIIASVTIEHCHPKLLWDTSSTPKRFKVYGLENEDSVEKTELGDFVFIAKNKTLMNFPTRSYKNRAFAHVELEVLSNYGHPNYTCVYRFRVHGRK